MSQQPTDASSGGERGSRAGRLAVIFGILSPILLLTSPFALYYAMQARREGRRAEAWIGLGGGGAGALVLWLVLLVAMLGHRAQPNAGSPARAALGAVSQVAAPPSTPAAPPKVSQVAAPPSTEPTKTSGQPSVAAQAATTVAVKMAEADALRVEKDWIAADDSYQRALEATELLRNGGDPLPGYDDKQRELIESARRAISKNVAQARVARERTERAARVTSALDAANSSTRWLEDAVRQADVNQGRSALQAGERALEDLQGLGAKKAEIEGLKRRLAREESKLERISAVQERARIKAAKEVEQQRAMARNKGPRPEGGWDGVVTCVRHWMNRNLKDPGSLEIIEVSPVVELPEYWAQRVKYRARNSFGGYVLAEQVIGFWNTNNDILNCAIKHVEDF
jgi:hypothetical protein